MARMVESSGLPPVLEVLELPVVESAAGDWVPSLGHPSPHRAQYLHLELSNSQRPHPQVVQPVGLKRLTRGILTLNRRLRQLRKGYQ